MMEVLSKMKNRSFKVGDVICSKKYNLYWHYGICLNDQEIIHFTCYPNRAWQARPKIAVTTFDGFLNNGSGSFLCHRPKDSAEAQRIVSNAFKVKEQNLFYIPLICDCKTFVQKCMETQNNHDTFYPESAAPLKKILSTVKARLGKSHPTFSELNILHGTK